MTARVVDSWALLAWLQGEEPARAMVHKIFESASEGKVVTTMSMLNVGEVFYLIAKRRGAALAERFLSELPLMPLKTLLPDRKLVLNAARLKARYPISYADAFAAETARQQNAALVTGDPELYELARHEPIDLLWVGTQRY